MYYLKIDGKKVRPEDVDTLSLYRVEGFSYRSFKQLHKLKYELIMLNRRYGYAK
jgi:hypothetical protein